MGPPENPPSSISKCVYRIQVVYYVPPRCCDIPSILWDVNGIEICNPGGGLSGACDGKCSEFDREKKDCLIVWKDSRSTR